MLLIALTGCIQVTGPAPAPSEPAVETPIAPVDEGPSDGDVEACDGLDETLTNMLTGATDRDGTLTKLATEYIRRRNLADDPTLAAALGAAADQFARAADEGRATGEISSSTQVDVQRATADASTACDGIG